MAINKVEYGGNTLIDITDTTATENDVLNGEIFYNANGTRGVGSLSLGNAKTYYGTSSTGASTAAKTVTCSGFVKETGATIFVKFTNGNSYNGTATLNVNSTGAVDIATVGDTKTSRYYWKSGEIVGFIYDGTNYVMIEQGSATTTYYGVTKLSSSTSSTSEAVAATPKAVKTAYDLANGKQDAITSTNKLDYSLIDNTPSIPSKTSDLQNDAGFITGYTETDPIYSASAAAGITSSDITSWNNKSTFSGDYNDLTNKPTIPTVNNGKLTIGRNGIKINDFTANSSSDVNVNISVPVDDVQINGNSIVSSGDANIVTNTAYNSSTNKIATMSDLPTVPTTLSSFTDDLGSSPTHTHSQYLTSYTETDPVFSASASAGITSNDITNWNNKTSNIGTITSVKMNGSTVASSGEADLGTVITSHQNIKTINNTSLVGTGDVSVQPTLVSGTNIKTINNTSILGSGNITIGGGGTATDVKINGTSITSNNEADIITNGTYDASTNKIATMSDIPSVPVTDVQINGTSRVTSGVAQIYAVNYSGVNNRLIDEMTLALETGVGRASSDYDWDSSGTYKKGQIVLNGRAIYRNKTGTNTSTNPPIDTTNWERVYFIDLTYDTGWVDITATKGTWSILRYRVVGKMVYVEGSSSSFKWSGSGGDNIKTSAIPSEYCPPNWSRHWLIRVAGTRMGLLYITTAGNIGMDYIVNTSNGGNYTTAVALDFQVSYMID